MVFICLNDRVAADVHVTNKNITPAVSIYTLIKKGTLAVDIVFTDIKAHMCTYVCLCECDFRQFYLT